LTSFVAARAKNIYWVRGRRENSELGSYSER
jgi:hypothetical protein